MSVALYDIVIPLIAGFVIGWLVQWIIKEKSA